MNLPPLTGHDFEQIQADKENCLIVFSKEGCKVCARLEPTMVNIAKDYEGDNDFHIYTMNVLDPSSRELFKSWQLVGVPQTAFIKDGVFKEALPGAIDEVIMRREIKNLIDPPKGLLGKLKNLWR